MTEYERGLRDGLLSLLRWAKEHDHQDVIDKIRKNAEVFGVDLGE